MRAVSTLLKLSTEEEQYVKDYLQYKVCVCHYPRSMAFPEYYNFHNDYAQFGIQLFITQSHLLIMVSRHAVEV